ncbi:predicted protein [Chaetoceros tenuissimus]|uniref:Uncharacterized protein n=1 Tax=Chaetoceros tenuissimus TaxID=426638 RepID=A0AAD3CQ05_9STRA|nr:predicted protein [Chaetoceros tenuissimus]
MKLSLAEKILEINETALNLLGGTGHVGQLSERDILFARGNMKMGARQVTSDILRRKMKERYEAWDGMTDTEKTAMSNKLVDELLELGKVFVVKHEGRYYEINMSIDKVHNQVRSEKVAQLFRDRKREEKKYISTFVELEKSLQREIVYVDNLDVNEKINTIYKFFLKVVQTRGETRKQEKIHNFYERHKQNPAVFDAMLTLCKDNHFVKLPSKVLTKNPMQTESNESMDEDEDNRGLEAGVAPVGGNGEADESNESTGAAVGNGGLEADVAGVFHAISNEWDTRLEADAVHNNEEAAESAGFTFDLSHLNGNNGENHSTSDRGMNDTDLDRIIASDNVRNENNMDVDDGVNYEVQRAGERNVHHDEFMEWISFGDNSSIDVSNLEDAQLSRDELLTVFD